VTNFGKEHTDRNLRILLRQIELGRRTPHILFYLGNEYRDHGRLSEAVEAYEDFLTLDGPLADRHSALTSIAACHRSLGNEERCVEALHRAITVDSSRAEAWCDLGDIHYDAEEWGAALPFFLAATGCTYPSTGFAVERCYTWFPWDRLAICYWKIDEVREAINATHLALESAPAGEIDRLNVNLDFFRTLI
jgi:tetratricopeptide (TPR) repeat protein